MSNSPSLLVVLRSIGFDVPDDASHVILNDYTKPTRISFIISGVRPPVTRDLDAAAQQRVLVALDIHRQTRIVAMRVDR